MKLLTTSGTIAKSGTRQFLESLTGDQQADAQLIGQFGVGFYSAFVVADRVTLNTRRAGASAADAVRWESDASGSYTLSQIHMPSRGTEVILHIKDDLCGVSQRLAITQYHQEVLRSHHLPDHDA